MATGYLTHGSSHILAISRRRLRVISTATASAIGRSMSRTLIRVTPILICALLLFKFCRLEWQSNGVVEHSPISLCSARLIWGERMVFGRISSRIRHQRPLRVPTQILSRQTTGVGIAFESSALNEGAVAVVAVSV